VLETIPGVQVIGLGHKARQGKDTVARTLIEARPRDVQRFSFADDLYAYCRVEHGMYTKDAPLLQRVGVAMREKDRDIWIRSVAAKIADARPRVAVITDVRFPNEFEFVKRLGGVCWRVTRRDAHGRPFVDPSRPANHSSETALDGAPWDYELVNPEGDEAGFRDLVRCTFHVWARRQDEKNLQKISA
jgi:hypothetical protein